jgi:hypothetical protein
MSEDALEVEFYRYFGFLKKDYGYSITRKNTAYFSEFSAKSIHGEVRVTFPSMVVGPPIVYLDPVGLPAGDRPESRIADKCINVAQLALYFYPEMEGPKWYESDFPRLPIEKLASCLKDHCQLILKGDYSEWPKIQAWLYDRMHEKMAEFQREYKQTGYEIVEKVGKVGLIYNKMPVLPVEYSSITVTNKDTNEYTLADYKDDSCVDDVSETNYAIITADGLSGLSSGREFRLPLEFLWIIKICWMYYLCQKTFDLYQLYSLDDMRKPVAEFHFTGKLTFSDLWQRLEKANPGVFSDLGKLVHKEDNNFISSYRFYGGSENIDSYIHGFRIASIHVVIHEDFTISEPVRIEKY